MGCASRADKDLKEVLEMDLLFALDFNPFKTGFGA